MDDTMSCLSMDSNLSVSVCGFPDIQEEEAEEVEGEKGKQEAIIPAAPSAKLDDARLPSPLLSKWHKTCDKLKHMHHGGKDLEELREMNQVLVRENEELMQELIATKIAYAETRMQCDEYKMQIQTMSKKMRRFSTHATSLEVKLNNARQLSAKLLQTDGQEKHPYI